MQDMTRALNTKPDVVRSAAAKEPTTTPSAAIDRLFGAPDKIDIPERYVPDLEAEEEVTPEERKVRLKKADSIRKMLADTAGPMAGECVKRGDCLILISIFFLGSFLLSYLIFASTVKNSLISYKAYNGRLLSFER